MRWWVMLLVVGAWGWRRAQGQQVPFTPCPDYFFYYRDQRSNQIMGALRIPPPQDSTVITKYPGSITTMEEKNAIAKRLREGNQDPILYAVHFPTQSPLPSLTRLMVNSDTVCSYDPEFRGSYTRLELSYVLTSPVPLVLTSNNNFGGSPSFPIVTSTAAPFSFFTTTAAPFTFRPVEQPQEIDIRQPSPELISEIFQKRPQVRPAQVEPQVTPRTQPKATPAPGFNGECGKAVQLVSLLIKGDQVSRGAWPWLSAIFITTKTGLEFQCGGTLVSSKHVITAAHCVKSPSQTKPLTAEEVWVYLGKHNLLNWSEQGSQAKEVSLVVVHPRYGDGSARTGNDVAILVLSNPAEFGLNVRPACLYDPLFRYPKEGSVVGWGKDEHGNRVSKEPKVAVLPIVSQEECLRSNKDFYHVTSNTTLCAGARNGVGPCSGDSGGGIFLLAEGKWHLRGVVSISLQDPTTQSCDLANYVVFTDLSKFSQWIRHVTGIAF